MVQNLTLGKVTENKNVFKSNEMSKNASLPRYENLNLPDFRVISHIVSARDDLTG